MTLGRAFAALGGVMSASLVGLWLFTPRPVALVAPGVTESLASMVHVRHGDAAAARNLRLVAVSVSQPLGWQRLWASFQPTRAVVPLTTVLDGLAFPQFWAAMQGQMWLAQRTATAVGTTLVTHRPLAVPVPGVMITATLPHQDPGALPLGSRILAINHHPVRSVAQAYRLVATAALPRVAFTIAGRATPLVVRRGPTTLQPETLAGWVLAPARRLPPLPPVTIARDGIAGSSGGLMLALAVMAETTHHAWDPGALVAGTGELTWTGQVLPVVDVPQKVATVLRAGATVFLVPRANAASARAMARRLGRSHSLQIVPVATVAQAAQWLRHPPREGSL